MKNILICKREFFERERIMYEFNKFILKIAKNEECFVLFNNVTEAQIPFNSYSVILFEVINEILEKNKSIMYMLHGAPMQPAYNKNIQQLFYNEHSNDNNSIYRLNNIKTLHWPTYYLHWTYNQIKPRYSEYDIETLGVEKNFEKLYINYNHRAHYHRCLMIDDLVKFKLFDYGFNSWIYINNEFTNNYDFKYWKPEVLKIDEFNLGFSDYGDFKDWPNNNLFTESLLKPNSFLNLVTESLTDIIFLSEKTWKPILLEQPFIILGSRNQNLELLKYGFKLYDEIFDYSFDSEEDLQFRVVGIINNLNRIKNKDYNELYDLIKEKIKFNKNRALQIIKNYEYFPIELIEMVSKIKDVRYKENGEFDIDDFLKGSWSDQPEHQIC